MAAVADLCIGELTKLRGKVIGSSCNPFFLRSMKKDAPEEKSDEITKLPPNGSSSSSSSLKSSKSQKTMSETTVFLLMDRFAPS
ncbi:hypothetical protein ABFS82_14G112300 [Erythranthe guttata]|uniref:Uncharacterized protein n=1 Tax=Erythranthe guttata TaxID=4155 RepID=A0A022RUL9_ERYGU|nr:hypothetical protein MIMGU_mgv1a017294mg [Erythranthe guttata]